MSPHDYVTPRELHEKLGELDDKLTDTRIETEKRFGRIEKRILQVGAAQAIVSGAVLVLRPDAAHHAKTAAAVVLHLFA